PRERGPGDLEAPGAAGRAPRPRVPAHVELSVSDGHIRIVEARAGRLPEEGRHQVPVGPRGSSAVDDLLRARDGQPVAVALEEPDEPVDAGHVLDDLVAAVADRVIGEDRRW